VEGERLCRGLTLAISYINFGGKIRVNKAEGDSKYVQKMGEGDQRPPSIVDWTLGDERLQLKSKSKSRHKRKG